jgi:uncharacterized protein
MNGTVTMSVKGLVLAALVLLALLAAYLLGGAGGTTLVPAHAAPEAAAAEIQQRTLRMVGAGEATVVPDQLTFVLSVTDKQAALDQALAGSSATMRRVLAALRDYGVRDADVQTTGLQMHPEYDYPAYSPPVLTGYRVTQRALVEVRDLARGGKAVSAAIRTGGNGVRATNLRLTVSDPDAALDRAREAAVAAATAKAERYAGAAGQDLGEVLSLREVGPNQPRQPRWQAGYLERAAHDELAALPIRAGKDDLTVRVEVVWALA